MKSLYDENYYERGIETGVSCYTNYRWMPELTIPMAASLIEHLSIEEGMKILDFGCAKGYLVKAFRLLHRQAFGCDASDYAISCAPEDVKAYISKEPGEGYDWIISKDVFEHIAYEDIDQLLVQLHGKTKNMFVVVPLGNDGKYVVPAYEMDKTHIIREDLEWWKGTFERAGFCVREATYSVKHIKENWSVWEKGNGFFVLDAQKESDKKDLILFGAGLYGRLALLEYGMDRVKCFCDNDVNKQGTYYCGKPVISCDELLKMADLYTVKIAIQNERVAKTIGEQLNGLGIEYERYIPNRYMSVLFRQGLCLERFIPSSDVSRIVRYISEANQTQRTLDILLTWFKLEQQERGLVEYLLECNIRSVSIMGEDKLAQYLFEVLKMDGRVSSGYIFDAEDDVDAVIVSNPTDYREVQVTKERYRNARVYSLKELVDAAFFRYVLAPMEMEPLK